MSVIIPVRNGRSTLARALRSVAEQEYAPFEVIVVDDGSVDDAGAVVREFPQLRVAIKRLNKPQGAAVARNHGLAQASGEFVAFLDADDEWLPGKTMRQVSTLVSDPEIAFAYTAVLTSLPGMAEVELAEIVDAQAHGEDGWKTLLKHGCVATSSVVARRELVCDVGGFDASLIVAEDQDLWIRLSLRGSVHHDDAPLVRKYRRRNSLAHLHRDRIASVTLPMIERHVAALDSRLTAAEKADILSYRRLVAGRNCYESGQIFEGAKLVLSATWHGGSATQNLLYLLSASPAARLAKRFVGRDVSSPEQVIPASVRNPERMFAVVVDAARGFTVTSGDADEREKSARALLEICRQYRIAPTFVVGSQLLADDAARALIAEAVRATNGSLGVYLPQSEGPDRERRRPGSIADLAYEHEFSSLSRMTETTMACLGKRPVVHKTDDPGPGPARALAMRALGYEIDVSLRPLRHRARDGSPLAWPNDPMFWFGDDNQLLEVPVTSGFAGPLAPVAPILLPSVESRGEWRGRFLEAMIKLGALRGLSLDFDGAPVAAQLKMIRSRAAGGSRVFCLSLSLATVGSDVGVHSDVRESFEGVLTFLTQNLAARPVTLLEIRDFSRTGITCGTPHRVSRSSRGERSAGSSWA